MAARLVVLCPGQGAQHPAMFDLARTDPAAGRLLDDWFADPVLAEPLGAAIEGTAGFANRIAQPSIVAATLAMWTALADALPQPALVAGYSIGELSAHAVAGALAPSATVKLALERAALMDACVANGVPQAMVALSAMPKGTAAPLMHRFGFHAAIVTGEDSLVAGGPAAQRDSLAEAAVAAGGRATVLPVEVASHTPLLAGAVTPFAALLARQQWSAPLFPVLSGISAEPVWDAARAKDDLSRQIAEPIRWMECMDACAEAGATVALELGPGAALSRMLQARHPAIACRSVTEFRSLDGIRSWLGRQLD
ncbi:ACP S-malonyltransferase [Pseudoduganella albidiflava]|uniref:Acyltransferase domain-containing protein n=1 Tax=Pseudoduganella albidiflava TaxID=321983 RepID=A0A411X0W8_9BURK|nr:acyltransferase domain-containing protein [Pseudoduganella albidiflava]QBI02613.1 acyltransferase domain-containing protein [Pseudoduganella albidiflava]GGY41345.1 malonate decarboxylase subunit epsilon [Pseudoduganella albidiflava]